MRFDKFLKAAEQRHPAIVLQVSWANGLDIIRETLLTRGGQIVNQRVLQAIAKD